MLCLQEQMARFHLRRKRLKIWTKQIPIILYIGVFFFFFFFFFFSITTLIFEVDIKNNNLHNKYFILGCIVPKK